MFTFNPVKCENEYGCTVHDWQGLSYSWELALPESVAPLYAKPTERACRGLAKLAWQVRRIEAQRLGVPVMKASWRRALYLAVLIHGRRKGINSWLMEGLRQRFYKNELSWC